MVSGRGVQALRMIQVSEIFYSYLVEYIAVICVSAQIQRAQQKEA